VTTGQEIHFDLLTFERTSAVPNHNAVSPLVASPFSLQVSGSEASAAKVCNPPILWKNNVLLGQKVRL